MLVENEPACYACHAAERRINGLLEVEFDYRGGRGPALEKPVEGDRPGRPQPGPS